MPSKTKRRARSALAAAVGKSKTGVSKKAGKGYAKKDVKKK